MLQLRISWDGPHTLRQVLVRFNDGGTPPEYEGEDYGLYQIYGRHILSGAGALLYIGEATDQTFSARFRQHQSWLVHEYPVRIYVGRLYDPARHTPRDGWGCWRADVLLAERIMIYKYSSHYNNSAITARPNLDGHEKVVLVHSGCRNRLQKRDVAPDEWE